MIKIELIDIFDCGDYPSYNWEYINNRINNSDLTYINEYYDGDNTLIFLVNKELTEKEMKDLNDAEIYEFCGREFKSPNFEDLILKIKACVDEQENDDNQKNLFS